MQYFPSVYGLNTGEEVLELFYACDATDKYISFFFETTTYDEVAENENIFSNIAEELQLSPAKCKVIVSSITYF